MSKLYRSKYEACPSLSAPSDDLRCDFEILVDELASMTGLLRATTRDEDLQGELLFVCELLYHMSPALRGDVTVTAEDLATLEANVVRLQGEVGERCKEFVLTQGSESGALAHMIRAKFKSLARLLYRHNHQGHDVEEVLLDFINLLSGYFFFLSMKLNALDGVEEIPYVSRNYK